MLRSALWMMTALVKVRTKSKGTPQDMVYQSESRDNSTYQKPYNVKRTTEVISTP